MPFKIYTYEDPYKLDKADFWSEISALPHFCGARTLVNGLKDVLGDNIKGLICPLDELVQHEEVYRQWTDNISLRVQQYSAFSSAFKQLLEKRRISKPFHMCLTDQVGNRNITLVGGLNGRGKTTFHDAILIALYGKQALKYIQEKARSYDKLLLEHINKHATDEETYVAVSLCLDDGTSLRVKRSWTAKGKKVEQQTIVEKNGVVDKYLGESWSYYIEEILPFGIARFFFFNNEKITQLADDTSFEQIKSSIKSAIGVSTIEKTIEHTDEVIRRKKNALAAFERSEENIGYQEVEKQIVDIDLRLADATKQANELERKCEALAAKLEAKEKEFWSSGGDLSRNRDAIKLEMQKISSEVERVNEEILQMAVDASTPLYMCRNLVTQSYDNELSSQQSEAKFYSDRIIMGLHQQILERLVDCGLSQADLRTVQDIINDVLVGHIPESATKETVKNLSATSMMLYQRLIAEVFQNVTQRIDTLVNHVEAQENEWMSLDAHLGSADEKTLLVSMMHVNSETGVIQPIEEVGAALAGTKTYFHVDATQGFGKLNDCLRKTKYNMLSITAHKLSGPQGVGALIMRRDRTYRRPPIKPLMYGGQQERGYRPGTTPVALVAGFALAAELCDKEAVAHMESCKTIRQSFMEAVQGLNYSLNGDQDYCLPSTINISFHGVDAEGIFLAVKEDYAFSNGSACNSGSHAPSYVLTAMGLDEARVSEAVRISWNHDTKVDFSALTTYVKSMTE